MMEKVKQKREFVEKITKYIEETKNDYETAPKNIGPETRKQRYVLQELCDKVLSQVNNMVSKQ